MPETPPDLERLKRQIRRYAAQVRPHHVAMVAVLSAVGLGVVAARTMALPGPRPILDDERRFRREVIETCRPQGN